MAMIAAPPAKIAGTAGSGPTFLEEKKKRDRSGTDADSGEQRIIESCATEFLVPASAQPKKREINQDRQCRARFDDEAAETVTDPFGGKARKNLVRAVKNCCYNCVPKPHCHGTGF